MKPETRFRRNQVIPFLKKLPKCRRFPIQQLTIRGDPDFLLCLNGYFVALELKDKGEKPRPLQLQTLTEVELAGGISLSADPLNWVEIKRRLLNIAQGSANGITGTSKIQIR